MTAAFVDGPGYNRHWKDSGACHGSGTVEEGKLADLVLTAGNPLDDIGLLCNPENIEMVMQAGNLVKGPAD